MKAKKPKAGPRGRAKRYGVSVSRETFRAIQAGAIRDGMSMDAWVEKVCRDVGVVCAVDCADCQAEGAF